MNIIIVGAGNIGSYLARTLSREGDKISLIEQNKELSEEVANEIRDILVINGDATELDTLRDAKASKADILISVTDDDNANLITCQLSKIEFEVQKTIAKVNEPEKKPLFEEFGVDKSITTINAAALSFKNSITSSRLKTLFSYEQEGIELNELKVKENSNAISKEIKKINFPKQSIITSIIRNQDIIFPRGDTEIKEGDRVQILMNSKVMNQIEKIFSP